MKYTYKMRGTLARPTHLFRYPPNGGTPDFMRDGEWVPDPQLLRYAQDDPLGADDVDRATARRVAAMLGWPTAVPEHDSL